MVSLFKAMRWLFRKVIWREGFAIVMVCVGALVLAYRLVLPAPGPAQVADACVLLDARPGWWRAVKASEAVWGVSPGLQLAVIGQESGFRRLAAPPRLHPYFVRSVRGAYRSVDGVIGTDLNALQWPTLMTAYGYPQAIDATWARYKTTMNKPTAMRVRFADAADFVGWYLHSQSVDHAIPLSDACALYLSYYTGHGQHDCVFNPIPDPKMQAVASKLTAQAAAYDEQIAGCAAQLDRDTRWWAWPFTRFG